ncbi:hypothetical protein CYMTET_32590 [Cymbomonas tetramitiformis]|uniref:Uncharacterized protein n=1 Tax=Cymbomonas tetramitiformis TaxID=36881 RepID=A0AAE0KRS1_9CHLO|nr:hypothetical protein CYMTET_32590 [Cymbomonas tetramitiformis]
MSTPNASLLRSRLPYRSSTAHVHKAEHWSLPPSHDRVAKADIALKKCKESLERTNHTQILALNWKRGHVTTFAGGCLAGFEDGRQDVARLHSPSGIEISSNARFLFVADGKAHRVRAIELATGQVTTIAGSGSAGAAEGAHADGPSSVAQFKHPADVCLSEDDYYLYVTDS